MSAEKPLILLADDSKDDCTVMKLALKRLEISCSLKTVPDGEALMQTLKKGGLPDLIMLDLNMPVKSGMEALAEIKEISQLKGIPIIIWSTSSNLADITEAYRQGASAYFEKPDSLNKVVAKMRVVTNYWFREAKLPGG